eukprot:9968848-Alexandrium_andersonii.AAC.1
MRAKVALNARQTEELTRRGSAMLGREGACRRNVAVLSAATGRRMVHTLWHLQNRSAGKDNLQALKANGDVKWGLTLMKGSRRSV